ncbi:MAG: hypothetical protein ACOH1T_11735 [Microbacteriaceae bacterium]
MIAVVGALFVPLIGVAMVIALDIRLSLRPILLALAAWCVIGGTWFAIFPDLGVAALQGAIAACVTLVVASVWPGMHRLALGAWVLLVVLLVAFASFDVIGGLLVASLGYVDFGSVSVLGVVVAATALGLPREGSSAIDEAKPSWVVGAVAAGGGVVGWIGLLVGAELTVDTLTPTIISTALLGTFAGVAGVVLAQLVFSRHVTAIALPTGVTAGGLAVAAGAPWLPSVAVVILGLVAGALSALALRTVSRRAPSRARQLMALTAPSAVLALIATGLFTSGPGWVNSGQPDLLFRELLGAGLIAVWAFLVSLLLRRTVRRSPASVG